jgi:hypothetical protein
MTVAPGFINIGDPRDVHDLSMIVSAVRVFLEHAERGLARHNRPFDPCPALSVVQGSSKRKGRSRKQPSLSLIDGDAS